MFIKKEFIKFEDKLLLIKKVIKEELRPNIDVWKMLVGADTVLKKDGLLYFLESVPELEIIE